MHRLYRESVNDRTVKYFSHFTTQRTLKFLRSNPFLSILLYKEPFIRNQGNSNHPSDQFFYPEGKKAGLPLIYISQAIRNKTGMLNIEPVSVMVTVPTNLADKRFRNRPIFLLIFNH